MITYIYALIDPRDNSIRYIGKANKPFTRIKEHHQERRTNKTNTHKNNWIKSLLSLNLKAKLQILEEVDFESWQEREKYWIKFYKSQENNKLTNYLEGGNGSSRIENRTISEETRQKISKSVTEFTQTARGKMLCRKGGLSCRGMNRGRDLKTGVDRLPSKKFKARINCENKHYDLGCYETEEMAAIVYDLKAIELFGKDAKLNFENNRENYLLNKIAKPQSSYEKKTSVYRGVHFTANRWQVSVEKDGKKHYCGRFKDEKDAALAYNQKAIELFGDKATLNLISI